MRRALALTLAMAVLSGCATTRCPDIKAPGTVTLTVEKFRPLPAWATRPLVLPMPRANTVDEAVRLANERLKVAEVANCHRRLLAKLDAGEPVDAKECER